MLSLTVTWESAEQTLTGWLPFPLKTILLKGLGQFLLGRGSSSGQLTFPSHL